MPHSSLKYPAPATDPASYEDDFVLWAAHQGELLRLNRFELLDRKNVIEELEDMGKNRHHALRSRMQVLVMHLLKWQFQSEHRSPSWRRTIQEQRFGIEDLLAESPSLQRFLQDYAQARYPHAVKLASIDTGLPTQAFPPSLPYAIAQLRDDDFLP